MLRKLAALVLPFGCLTLCIVSAFGFFAARHVWAADLVNFFRPHIAVAGGFGAVALLLGRRRRWIALAAATAVAAILPQFVLPPSAPPSDRSTLRIVSANLMIEKPDVSDFARYLETVKADIVVTQETRESAQGALRPAAGLPYESFTTLPARDDMKLFSRFPILSEAVVRMQEKYPRLRRHPVRFVLQGPTGAIILYAVHPDTPRTPWQWRQRNMYLALLRDAIGKENPGATIIVAGDWNTPSWSPYFRDTIAAAALRTAESSWWPSPTRFSTRFGSIVQLGMTIDHIAVSRDIGVKARWTGPKNGSNHVPVVADLALPEQ